MCSHAIFYISCVEREPDITHCENCEYSDKDVSLDSSSCDSTNAAESEADQNSLSSINLDPDCCRHSLVDLEQTNWAFSFDALELPDINSIGVDREVMTIHPVSDPFHYNYVNTSLAWFWA